VDATARPRRYARHSRALANGVVTAVVVQAMVFGNITTPIPVPAGFVFFAKHYDRRPRGFRRMAARAPRDERGVGHGSTSTDAARLRDTTAGFLRRLIGAARSLERTRIGVQRSSSNH